ncbi:MAG: orotidine-5'-phosphate decarboxylase [Candidatus Latescibacteria bacterium]|nr:orotidine-5'-phosphate decarboxylase [Candidatus Latescibacterota bacterium]
MAFCDKLREAQQRNQSLVCVGLDPDTDRLPEPLRGSADPVGSFLGEIVAATRDLACVYKPNFAFFGAMGSEGWDILQGVLETIPDDIPTLLDFKAGDIGNTAAQYARMAYEHLGADAATVNPLMGRDAVEPFLAYADRCAFLLCLTSNPGSGDFQRLTTDDGPLYQAIARRAVAWSEIGSCGLVVGATHPGDLREVREIAPDLPFLIPGVGAQGGDADAVVREALDTSGGGIVVNASRSILYASNGSDFADAARRAAEELRQSLERARENQPDG